MRIKSKLMAVFGLLFCLIAGVGGFASLEIRHVGAESDEIVNDWLPDSLALGNIKYLVTQVRLYTGQLFIVEGAAEKSAVKETLAKTTDELAAAMARYQSTIAKEQDRVLWDRFVKAWSSYQTIGAQAMQLDTGGDGKGAREIFSSAGFRSFNEVLAGISAHLDFNQNGALEQGGHIHTSTREAFWVFSGLLAAALLLCAGSVYWTSTDIVRPLDRITAAMHQLSQGDLATRIPFAGRRDEIGIMAATLAIFKDSIAAQKAASENAAAEAAQELERARRAEAITREFEQRIGGIVETVSSASSQLNATASDLTKAAEQTSGQSACVVSASSEASSNVSAVASAAEQLSASIREISQQMQQSHQISQEAAREADNTTGAVHQLNQMAENIGNIVSMISGIAAQTNMLALNATIEAARAGEAGKGFAVVASEVKGLAEQTAKATAEITSQITAIQDSTQATAASINRISKTIQDINTASSTVASAVEEQGAATQEIARNAQHTSSATNEVARSITGVQEAANNSSRAASQVLESSQELARQSDALQTEVTKFLSAVRAA